MAYTAPLADMLFVLRELAGLDAIQALPGFEEASADTVTAVLQEAARFNQEVVAPLNWAGDLEPAHCRDGIVTTTPGFVAAFKAFGAAGLRTAGALAAGFAAGLAAAGLAAAG